MPKTKKEKVKENGQVDNKITDEDIDSLRSVFSLALGASVQNRRQLMQLTAFETVILKKLDHARKQ